MTSNIKHISLTHERDAAWLIALYLAIHGGDPAPNEGVVTHEVQQGAAVRAIAALSAGLDEKAGASLQHALAPLQKEFPLKSVDAMVAGERLAAMGLHITEHAEHAPAANVTDAVQAARRYCIRFHGQVVCVDLPSPVHHQIA